MHKAMMYVESARPVIKQLLQGGELMAVEGSDDEVCKMLDLTCGTDYFQVYSDTGLVWGIASRMQEADRPWNTFTVRKERASGVKTEYEKRADAIKRGGVYPFLTMQGYINRHTGELMSLAIARTIDIMAFIESGLATVRRTGADQKGQATFFVVDWEKLKKAGYRVKVYTAMQRGFLYA